MWDGGNGRKEVHGILGFTEAPNEVPERWSCLGTHSRAMPCHSPLTPEGKERKDSLVLRSC